MLKIVDALQAWMMWGVEQQPNYTLKRKILLTNMVAIAALFGWAFYVALFIAFGVSNLNAAIYAVLPFYLMMALVPWLNRLGKYDFARLVSLSATITSVLIPIWIFFGNAFNSHFYFLLLAAAPIVLFTLRQWLLSLAIFLACVALFFLVQTGFFAVQPAIREIEKSTLDLIGNTFIFFAALNFLIFAWFIDKTTSENEQNLGKQAVTDVLTGIPNRRFFDLAFSQEIAKAKRLDTQLILAVIDIDHFKQINDIYGHDAGDEVLQQFADLLLVSTRAGNVIARIGGEEFAVLFPGITVDAAIEAAERIRNAAESTTFNYAGQALKITISLGLSQVRVDIEQTFKAADSALYLAKQGGRNRVVIGLEALQS